MPLQVRRFVRGPLEDDEALRIVNWQRPKENCINQAEDGGVGADAEGEREDGGGSKARRFAQHAEGEAEVLEKRVEERKAASIAVFVFGLLRAAEADEGLAAGFGGREATLKIFFDGELQVGRDFVVEVAVEPSAAEEGTYALKHFADLSKHFGTPSSLDYGFERHSHSHS
jgi:hypothetical protein